MGGRSGPKFQDSPSGAWRMSTDTSIEATFCFVDIAGYTALTDTHGELAAANLVDDFEGLVRASLGPSGHLQSLTGDCAFLTFADPPDALAALSDLYRSIADRQAFPVVRAGLHHGSALFRADRHFGTTVNLAARVAAQATGGQILCTREVANALRCAALAGIELRHKGSMSLKNLPAPVDLFEVLIASCVRDYAIDPVCKMQIDTRRAAGDLLFDSKTYWFCSLACAERFAGHPSAYVASSTVTR